MDPLPVIDEPNGRKIPLRGTEDSMPSGRAISVAVQSFRCSFLNEI
jgi:hypothetical protein